MPADPATKENSKATQGRSCAINQAGTEVAIGMRDGTFRLYSISANANNATVSHKYSKKISKEWIEDLKYSPDGKYLAVGSHDNKIYLYDCSKGKFTCKFGKSSSFITHLDWSIDSAYLRTNDGSYEILYYTIPDGKQDTSGATNTRDMDWATQSCVLGWACQGIWEPSQDGSDINHADKSTGPVNGGT